MCERATNKKLNWIHINWDRVMTIKFLSFKKTVQPWLWNLIQLCLRGKWWWNNFPLIVFSWHVLIFVFASSDFGTTRSVCILWAIIFINENSLHPSFPHKPLLRELTHKKSFIFYWYKNAPFVASCSYNKKKVFHFNSRLISWQI